MVQDFGLWVMLFREDWRERVMDFIVSLHTRKQKLTRCLGSRYLLSVFTAPSIFES
jgi:hypothetical protein